MPVRAGAAVLLAGLLSGLVVTAGPAAAQEPAAAHGPAAAQATEAQELVDAEPAPETVLTEVPTRIALTFGSEVTDPQPTLRLLDSEGDEVTTALPVVEDAMVVLPLQQAVPNDVYTVEWALVAGDGEPVAGEYQFVVEAPATAVPTTVVAPSPVTETAPLEVPEEVEAEEVGETSAVGIWLAVGVGVLALAVGIGIVVSRRRRRSA